MTIHFVSGDILQAREQYIAQGVAVGNQEGLGTGLAFKISSRWPEVQAAFKRHARQGRFNGGDIWVHPPLEGGPGFIYLATQPDMYHATLPFLRRSVRKLANWAKASAVESIALPKIGAGLGKLSWSEEVKPLLSESLREHPCAFMVYEDYTHGMDAAPPA
ncbi:Appr-1-p processing protein [Bosea sp. BK604]|uniref:Appr-1-p processing protein n=1 Tax=Bosea sp. BK604 TaxID=2512180 RepID=UPI001047C91E|nr:Appr-1-p processing protein [Bosea sp. BK604]TCR67611.1 O-acetyl-ADP-ribose deacetylase (regulator of RNase III) [Bosea sp. BK604]